MKTTGQQSDIKWLIDCKTDIWITSFISTLIQSTSWSQRFTSHISKTLISYFITGIMWLVIYRKSAVHKIFFKPHKRKLSIQTVPFLTSKYTNSAPLSTQLENKGNSDIFCMDHLREQGTTPTSEHCYDGSFWKQHDKSTALSSLYRAVKNLFGDEKIWILSSSFRTSSF